MRVEKGDIIIYDETSFYDLLVIARIDSKQFAYFSHEDIRPIYFYNHDWQELKFYSFYTDFFQEE